MSSQESSDNASLKLSHSQVSVNSQLSSGSKEVQREEEENPFLKRKATNEDLDARKR